MLKMQISFLSIVVLRDIAFVVFKVMVSLATWKIEEAF